MQEESSKGSKEKSTKPTKEEPITRAKKMKYDFKRRILESNIISCWVKVGDINMVHVDYEDFKQRMYCYSPTPLEKRLVEKQFAQADGFPPLVECPELIIECSKHYDSNNKNIIGPQGSNR